MKLDNFGIEDHGTMYWQKRNDIPMRQVYCPYCGRPFMKINYDLVELTNSSGVALEIAHKEVTAVIEWRCRNCRAIWSIYLR